MQLYQRKTSQVVKDKIEAVGGEESIAKEIIDGLTWRLGHDPYKGSYILDEEKNIRIIKTKRQTDNDPIVILKYQVLNGDPYYGIELMDVKIIP